MNTYFQNQDLQRGIRQDPYNYELMDEIQQVEQQVGYVANQMQTGMNEVIRKVDAVTRKKRKSIVNRQLVTFQDGSINVVELFDDGTKEVKPFIWNIRGTWKVYKICIRETGEYSCFGIFFLDTACWIIGKRDRVKTTYLYESFIRAGVIFNSEISRASVGKILFETFAPAIELTDSTLTISELAGWEMGEYYHADNFLFAKIKDFSSFPVVHKHFEVVTPQEWTWEAYFMELKRIKNTEDRLLVTLFPYAGILSSLLMKEHCIWPWVLNFICLEDFPLNRICAWLQVMNREDLQPISMEMSEKEWEKTLVSHRDEVLIADCYFGTFETSYYKGKIIRRRQKTIEYFTKDRSLSGSMRQNTKPVLAIISNEFCPGKTVHNVFLNRETYEPSTDGYDTFLDGKVMEAVLTGFVSYVKSDLEEIRSKMRKRKGENPIGEYTLEAVLDIVKGFWESEGIDFSEALKIPHNINFSEMINRVCYDEEELVEAFIEIMRHAARNMYFVLKKSKGMVAQRGGYYNMEYVWIPRDVLYSIIQSHGMERYLSQILLRLKAQNDLKTDEEGLTRKMQVNGERREYYQFARKFFNKDGLVDIVNLGKSGNGDDR